jgi:FtsZ-binding cell division protein ZapB
MFDSAIADEILNRCGSLVHTNWLGDTIRKLNNPENLSPSDLDLISRILKNWVEVVEQFEQYEIIQSEVEELREADDSSKQEIGELEDERDDLKSKNLEMTDEIYEVLQMKRLPVAAKKRLERLIQDDKK